SLEKRVSAGRARSIALGLGLSTACLNSLLRSNIARQLVEFRKPDFCRRTRIVGPELRHFPQQSLVDGSEKIFAGHESTRSRSGNSASPGVACLIER
ncbi:MAG: hypothetical protein ABJC66_01925, partial [Gammaproteobacteria bacterium]